MFIRVGRVGAQDRTLQPENEVFLARACGLRRNSFEAASFHFQDTAEMRSCTTPPRQLLVGLRDNNFAPFDSFACTLVGKASYSSPARLDLFFYAHTICDRAITSPSCGLFLSFIIFLTHFLLFTTSVGEAPIALLVFVLRLPLIKEKNCSRLRVELRATVARMKLRATHRCWCFLKIDEKERSMNMSYLRDVLWYKRTEWFLTRCVATWWLTTPTLITKQKKKSRQRRRGLRE